MAGKKETEKKEASKTPKRDTSKSRSRKSPARDKSKSPVKKSPARNKSPSRKSPSRKSPSRKSPSRAKKPASPSPARKSPSRNAKSAEKLQSNASKKASLKYYDSDSDFEPVQEVKEKPKVAVRGRTRNIDSDKYNLTDYVKETIENEMSKSGLTRRSTRASQSSDVERVVHLTQKLSEFSDEDDLTLQKTSSTSVDKQVQSKKRFAFAYKILPILTAVGFPAYVYALHVFCNEFQCSFKKPVNFGTYQKLSTYFHLQSSLVFSAYVVLLAILSVIPFGGRKISELPNKHGKFDYNINGLFSLFVTIVTVAVLEIYGIRAFDFIDNHIVHFVLPALIFSVLLALGTYIRSFRVPLSALSAESASNGALLNFLNGREINPRFFGIWDVKVYAIRLCLISSILLTTAYFFKSLTFAAGAAKTNSFFNLPNFDPTVTVLYILTFIYILDGLIFEGSYLSSFEVQYRGFGFLNAAGYILYPFMAVLYTKYPYQHGLNAPIWKLVVGTVTFLIGFWLYRASNSQKDAFRRNPYAPSLSHLETLPTSQGKKLIVSSYWGFVRHPNYLGDILLHLALLLFFYNVPVATVILFSIFFLLIRSVIDGYSCKQKYGAAWDRYCQKVKYVLIPKIY